MATVHPWHICDGTKSNVRPRANELSKSVPSSRKLS
jgi:hypothetical protein